MIKTYRHIPDSQSHFAVFFHKYPPQHVSHGDGDDDRRRCLEHSCRLKSWRSSFHKRSNTKDNVSGTTREPFWSKIHDIADAINATWCWTRLNRDCKDTDSFTRTFVNSQRSTIDKRARYVTITLRCKWRIETPRGRHTQTIPAKRLANQTGEKWQLTRRQL